MHAYILGPCYKKWCNKRSRGYQVVPDMVMSANRETLLGAWLFSKGFNGLTRFSGWIHLIVTTYPWGRYSYHSHFKNQETGTKRCSNLPKVSSGPRTLCRIHALAHDYITSQEAPILPGQVRKKYVKYQPELTAIEELFQHNMWFFNFYFICKNSQ